MRLRFRRDHFYKLKAKAGVSLPQLSELSGLAEDTLQRIGTERFDNPAIKTVTAVASGLRKAGVKCSPLELLEEVAGTVEEAPPKRRRDKVSA